MFGRRYDIFRNIFKVRNFCSQKEILEKRRSEIMARGLPKKKPITGVQHVVLVASGKGGVGKSTTSVNLATALKLEFPNKNIGLLDTDVFGPSIPLMMNLNDSPLLNEQNFMIPLVNYGVKCMSMGFLLEEGSAAIWRGLMVMQAIDKLLRQVYWDSIDYLIVDTPPGTGDTHLSLMQNIPVSGVILVTTPQSAALQITKRGATMYKKLGIPIIGLVENMSFVTCTSCAAQVKIFGMKTATLANEIGTEILATFPLVQEISDNADKGTPIVIANPKCEEAKSYTVLANKIVQFLDKSK